MSSRAPTPEELDGLYTRLAAFVTQRLRTSQSPSLSARAMVHCKQMATHYRVPLTGVNQLRFNGIMAHELDDLFPGWEVAWLPDPDNSKMEYVLLVPLDLAIRSRPGKKHRHYMMDDNGGGGGGSLGVPLLILVGVLIFGLISWWTLIPSQHF